jgi:stress-induced morphogen
MISNDALIGYIKKAIPDVLVSVHDRTGTMDHFMIRVVSETFQSRSLLDRHRLIYQALSGPMSDGRIHALEIQAQTPQEASETTAAGFKSQNKI